MRSMRRKRALVVSTATILLCLSIVAGATWALFTDTQVVKNHLVAGDLTISLTRTELTKTYLNDDGFLVTEQVQKPTDEEVGFTNPSGKNVFGLTVDEKVVPGSKYVATMKVNNQSDVAFNYWIRIDCKDEDAAKALANQIAVTVYRDLNGDGEIDMETKITPETEAVQTGCTVSSGLEDGDDENFVGLLAKGKNETFVVSVEFVDLGYEYENGVLSSDNNPAQGQDVEFDLIVYAIQATDAPVIETETTTETTSETTPETTEGNLE